ncbi:hypothetical protein COL922a_010309 [Colletotrichum nupharicola]|nr:hypothetical protein COL922a_010309 [Colletotrichum nupharicola]
MFGLRLRRLTLPRATQLSGNDTLYDFQYDDSVDKVLSLLSVFPHAEQMDLTSFRGYTVNSRFHDEQSPYLFRRPYKIRYIPITSDRSLRILVFKELGTGTGRNGLRPLHVDCHPGGFVGGIPEADAPFWSLVAKETGAVVVSLSYRLAPVHPFPTAIDDVDAALAWLREHAEDELGADPRLMTVSGASAGGNLVLAASQSIPSEEFAIRAAVTFYAPIDLRPKPEEKPRPANFPSTDPLALMLSLYDSYAAPAKATNRDNPRMSPYLASEETLPERMLLVVAAIDITVHEQLTFVERVRKEREDKGKDGQSVEALYLENAFHGCLEGEYKSTHCLYMDY